MRIDVALNPAEIDQLTERELAGTTCVVLDVLRATSSIVTGLAHGVLAFRPVETIEEAFPRHTNAPERSSLHKGGLA